MAVEGIFSLYCKYHKRKYIPVKDIQRKVQQFNVNNGFWRKNIFKDWFSHEICQSIAFTSAASMQTAIINKIHENPV